MNNRTKKITICALAIAINVVFGIMSSSFKLPLYLDTIGTVLVAVFYGPWIGAAVGGITNVITSLIMGNPQAMPFLLVSVVIGLLVGFIARKWKFNFVVALITGLLLSVVAPLIGTPIGILVYGGLTGTVSDVLFLLLKNTGMSVFTASFIPKIMNNLLDKVATCLLVYVVIKAMPKEYKPLKK